MALLDLPTRQDFDALLGKVDALLGLLNRPAPPVDTELLDLQQVADYTRFNRKTVEKWVEQGEYNEAGKKIYLPAFRFSGRLRFKRAEVEAFGLGIGALVPALGAGPPEPVKTKKKAPVASEKALRRAA